MTTTICIVALRKESVDRNQGVHYDNYNLHWSLSARRAWIEIDTLTDDVSTGGKSLSARRAWIEIVMQEIAQQRKQSLSARRAWIEIRVPSSTVIVILRRSPQGERG